MGAVLTLSLKKWALISLTKARSSSGDDDDVDDEDGNPVVGQEVKWNCVIECSLF